MNFGHFFQEVCSSLVLDYDWDDPYGSCSPQYDPTAKLLNIIHVQYHKGVIPKVAATAAHLAQLEE